MDRISDSGSDDYGSTPYGDTLNNPQFSAYTELRIYLSILRANTLSQSFKTITYI